MSEATFQKWITAFARENGWRIFHVNNSTKRLMRGTSAGFPDLTMVYEDELIFMEVKAEGGKLSEAQEGWRTALEGLDARNAGIQYHVVYPSDKSYVMGLLCTAK